MSLPKPPSSPASLPSMDASSSNTDRSAAGSSPVDPAQRHRDSKPASAESDAPESHEPGVVSAVFWGGTAVCGTLLLLVLVQGASFGRVGAEKMLTELALPLGMLWFAATLAIGCGIAMAVRSARRRRQLWPTLIIASGFWLALTVLGNRSLADWAWQRTQHPLPSGDIGSFDAVIVLGGGIGADPLDRPQLNGDGDRIRPPLQLWHAGRVDQIYATGTSSLPDERDPGELTKDLLVSFGVPAAAVTTVTGRNTSEEMAAIRELIGSPAGAEPPRVGVVTSAFHMPRALRLARDQGLELVPLPVAFRGGGSSTGWARSLVPSSGAMADLSTCWKEWLATAVGR